MEKTARPDRSLLWVLICAFLIVASCNRSQPLSQAKDGQKPQPPSQELAEELILQAILVGDLSKLDQLVSESIANDSRFMSIALIKAIDGNNAAVFRLLLKKVPDWNDESAQSIVMKNAVKRRRTDFIMLLVDRGYQLDFDSFMSLPFSGSQPNYERLLAIILEQIDFETFQSAWPQLGTNGWASSTNAIWIAWLAQQPEAFQETIARKLVETLIKNCEQNRFSMNVPISMLRNATEEQKIKMMSLATNNQRARDCLNGSIEELDLKQESLVALRDTIGEDELDRWPQLQELIARNTPRTAKMWFDDLEQLLLDPSEDPSLILREWETECEPFVDLVSTPTHSQRNSGMTAMSMAIYKQRIDIVRWLLDHSASVYSREKISPIMRAFLLLESNADFRESELKGWHLSSIKWTRKKDNAVETYNPLVHAIERDEITKLQTLLSAGQGLGENQSTIREAIAEARKRNRDDIVKLIITGVSLDFSMFYEEFLEQKDELRQLLNTERKVQDIFVYFFPQLIAELSNDANEETISRAFDTHWSIFYSRTNDDVAAYEIDFRDSYNKLLSDARSRLSNNLAFPPVREFRQEALRSETPFAFVESAAVKQPRILERLMLEGVPISADCLVSAIDQNDVSTLRVLLLNSEWRNRYRGFLTRFYRSQVKKGNHKITAVFDQYGTL